MKKILAVCGVAAALLGMSACGNSGSASQADKGFADSLATYLGMTQGMRLASDYNSIPQEQKDALKKDDILRGFKQVIMTDTTQQGYLTGLSFGLQLAGQLYRYEQAGIPVDRAKVYEAYAKYFKTDSVSMSELSEAQGTFQMLAQQAQQKIMQYYQAQEEAAKAAKENSPEAKENKEKGAAYVQDAIKNDPSIKTTTVATVTVFDSNDQGANLSPRGTVPGFAEGLAMMNKGAKYILYIPGELAYGVDGQPQAGIGPNATLVFEVEAVEVTPGK